MAIKFKSPAQLTNTAAKLASLEYDANTRIAQQNDGTIVISNRTGVLEVMTNGEHRFRGELH